jgi:FAS-associated factor 2
MAGGVGGLFAMVQSAATLPLTTFKRLCNGFPTAQEDAEAFLAEYDRDFAGVPRPAFQRCSYHEALSRAKRESKFLLVYAHSADHGETRRFCGRGGLLSCPQFVEFVDANCVCWGGSVARTDGLRTACRMGFTAFPAIALVVSTASSGAGIADRLMGAAVTGPRPEAVLARLARTLARQQGVLDAARAERVARETERELRSEQDRAFEESLAADRAKGEELRRARERAQSEAEAEEERRAVELSLQLQRERALAEKRARVEAETEAEREAVTDGETVGARGPEPHPAEASGTAADGSASGTAADGSGARRRKTLGPAEPFVFRLPNGRRLSRTFRAGDTMRLVRDFLDVSLADADLKIERYSLNSNFPRKSFTRENAPDDADLRTVGLVDGSGAGISLFLHDLDA